MAGKRSENLSNGNKKVRQGRARRLAAKAKAAEKASRHRAKLRGKRLARAAKQAAKENAKIAAKNATAAAKKARKEARKHLSRKDYYSRLIVVFVAVLAVLVVLNIFAPDTDFSDEENRVMTTKPDLTTSSFFEGRYAPEYESYINDQFPFRNFLIRLKTTADVLTGKVESNGVYKGHDGYLMEQFKDPGRQKTRAIARLFTDFARSHSGQRTYLFTVPTAVNILSDKLPANTDDGGQNDFIDNLYKRVKKGGVKTIDARKIYNEKKDKVQLYYHSDHHWTSTGAYYGFLAAARTLGLQVNTENYKPSVVKDDFKGMLASKSGFYMCSRDDIEVYFPPKDTPVSVITYVDDQKKSASFYKAANLEEKDAYTVFTGGNHSLIKIKSASESKDNLLIIKDSYANCFIPFIAPYYRNVVVVDPRYYFNDLDKLIRSEDITDVLFLYNANTLATDSALKTMLTY